MSVTILDRVLLQTGTSSCAQQQNQDTDLPSWTDAPWSTGQFQGTRNRVRGNGLRVCQGRFRLESRDISSLKEWSGIGTATQGSEHGGAELMVGLDDLGSLFQSK